MCVVLEDVTVVEGVTMAVSTVTGVIIALIHVGKVVPAARVKDGLGIAHRVLQVSGETNVTNYVVMTVRGHVFS